MASANTLPRILYVHAAIKNGEAVNARTIVKHFGGSLRSAYRTIAYLRDQLHAPLAFDSRRNSYYYLDPGYELPSQPLSPNEATAVLLVYHAVLERLPLPLARDLAAAARKLQAWLPQRFSAELADLSARITFVPEPVREVSHEVLDSLQEALETRRTVRLRYYTASRDDTAERDFDPYHLSFRNGDWYAVGWCHLRQQVRTFAASRVRNIAPSRHKFEIPPSFDAAKYFEGAFTVETDGENRRVVVEFDAPSARYVGERAWHPSQKLVRLDGGRLRVELCLSLSHELRSWVLSYGSGVRVLEPSELAGQIARELRKAAASYR